MDFRIAAYEILLKLQNCEYLQSTVRIGALNPEYSAVLIELDRARKGVAERLDSEYIYTMITPKSDKKSRG